MGKALPAPEPIHCVASMACSAEHHIARQAMFKARSHEKSHAQKKRHHHHNHLSHERIPTQQRLLT
jgi:hypothetical protein